jgi:beta-lactamase regulating signal transducer with metallopeptidase domain
MTPLVPALLAKLTLILAAGLVVTATLRSFSPSLRHLILFAALATGVALPFAMLMAPQWNVAVLPRATAAVFSVSSASTITKPGPSASKSALNAKVIDASGAPAPGDARDISAAIPLLPIAWVIGFLAVMGWLAIGRFRLGRIAAGSWALDDSAWSGILDEERKYAGVAKPVLLFSSSVVSTPLTWGSRDPVILLPEDALDWPEAHRRIVLRHELAHISRGDSFTQLVAGFVCALYWFHPLVWITERRLRAECERACDDNVVSLGTPATEYAAHLLEVARSARAFGAPGFLSVAMARPSQLEGRLLAVLSESRRRVSLSPRARRVAALLSAFLLIPLAAFHAVPKVDGSTPAIANSALSEPTWSIGSGTATSAAPTQPRPTTTLSAGARQMSNRQQAADTTFQLSVPVRSAGTLTLDLKTGGNVIITGSDKPEVFVRASLGGRDWRDTQVSLKPSSTGAQLETRYTGHSNSQSTRHAFEIRVPRSFNVRISSSGGSLSIAGVDGTFTGNTGGGEINIQKANGEVDIQTGGGDVHVSDSRLSGSVSTGGGIVEIEGVTGNLSGYSGSGPVTYVRSSGSATIGTKDGVHVGVGTGKSGVSVSSESRRGSGGVTTSTTYITDGVGRASSYASSGITMKSAGGPITLPAAPEGARVTTGGGPIRIGPSGGEIYASTGGGPIDIGPATGSVEAHTGGGPVTIQIRGAGAHSVDVTSGKGEVVLDLPRDLDATLELETAYTDNLGHKTTIVSDWPLPTTETDNWDRSEGTPRRYVRARQTIGRGGSTIRVRTVNGNIIVHRER